MKQLPPTGKLPNWNVGGLHLVPVDPYVDPNLDTPDRQAQRARSPRVTTHPIAPRCDDVVYDVVVEVRAKVRAESHAAAFAAAYLGMHIDVADVAGLEGPIAVWPGVVEGQA